VAGLIHKLGRLLFDQNTHVVQREFMQKRSQTGLSAWFSPMSVNAKT
jgi:hypothetical protein